MIPPLAGISQAREQLGSLAATLAHGLPLAKGKNP